jgi:anti-sigma regulatory factor (Ser/Thr protein kinase)
MDALGARMQTIDLSADMTSLAAARRFVDLAVEGCGGAGYRELICVLASELVTNAIAHGGGAVALTVTVGDDSVTVAVADGSAKPPVLGHPAPEDEHGHGLQLVAELATSWGYQPTGSGKVVWFTLAS